MRYNKRTSSACDWPFHFFQLFYSLQASPLSSQIIQLRMSVSHLCFAPRVFLTSCNFDEQKSPSSSSWKQIVKFGCCFGLILMNFQKAQHLISSFDSIFLWANQCRPNEQGFNEERMSIKRGSLQLLIHHIFSCINCAGSFCTEKERRRDQVFRKEIISILLLDIPGEPLLDAISIIWPYSCRERVENDERNFSPNMSH